METFKLKFPSKVFLNAVTKDDDAMKGLEDISDLLVRCKVREDTYRRRIAGSTGKRHVIKTFEGLKGKRALSLYFAFLLTATNFHYIILLGFRVLDLTHSEKAANIIFQQVAKP